VAQVGFDSAHSGFRCEPCRGCCVFDRQVIARCIDNGKKGLGQARCPDSKLAPELNRTQRRSRENWYWTGQLLFQYEAGKAFARCRATGHLELLGVSRTCASPWSLGDSELGHRKSVRTGRIKTKPKAAALHHRRQGRNGAG